MAGSARATEEWNESNGPRAVPPGLGARLSVNEPGTAPRKGKLPSRQPALRLLCRELINRLRVVNRPGVQDGRGKVGMVD